MFPQRLGSARHQFTIDTIGYFGCMPNAAISTNSGAFPAAKRVIYIPIRIPSPITVQQLYITNGAAVSGNVDVGLYTLDGRKLVSSGSTVQAGTATRQLFDVADFRLGRGAYYMAVSLDNNTGTLQRIALTTIGQGQMAGVLAETPISFGLPAIASFASPVDAYLPLIGLLAQSVM